MICECKYLVSEALQLNKRVEDLKSVFELFLTDKNIPLSDRLQMYFEAPSNMSNTYCKVYNEHSVHLFFEELYKYTNIGSTIYIKTVLNSIATPTNRNYEELAEALFVNVTDKELSLCKVYMEPFLEEMLKLNIYSLTR